MITEYIPEIIESRDAGGFIHPGIGVSACQLRTMQCHARAEDEPWLSSFTLLSSHPRAAVTAKIEYREGDPDYFTVPFGDGGLRVAHNAQRDGDTASKQALMYVITGDVRHRERCMKILRLWSQIERAALHRDQQIRWGIALYKLCFAAEIMRCTTIQNEDIEWNDEDEKRFRTFLSAVEFTVDGWWYFMNQHSYALKGYMAKTIFCGERDKYNVCVERATVHRAYEPHNRGRNGSIKYQIPAITEDIETDERIDPPFIEVTEVGRDQAHAYGNIGSLSEIAMTAFIQGTRVDHITGEPSDADDATGIFEFLDDRLLRGADYIARYNLGYKTKYYKTYFDSPNSWNKRQFGRVDPVFGILYHYYKYIAKRDIRALAPYMCEIYEKFSSPEGSIEEFVGYSGLLYAADDAADDYVLSPVNTNHDDGVYMCADYTAVRTGCAEILTEGGETFVRTMARDGGSEIADRTFGWPKLGRAVLRLRTDGDAIIRVAKYDPKNVLARIPVADTNMEWIEIPFRFEGNGEDSTILFYTVTGDAGTVDLHYLKLTSEEHQ